MKQKSGDWGDKEEDGDVGGRAVLALVGRISVSVVDVVGFRGTSQKNMSVGRSLPNFEKHTLVGFIFSYFCDFILFIMYDLHVMFDIVPQLGLGRGRLSCPGIREYEISAVRPDKRYTVH
jgi:hypothetical protein